MKFQISILVDSVEISVSWITSIINISIDVESYSPSTSRTVPIDMVIFSWIFGQTTLCIRDFIRIRRWSFMTDTICAVIIIFSSHLCLINITIFKPVDILFTISHKAEWLIRIVTSSNYGCFIAVLRNVKFHISSIRTPIPFTSGSSSTRNSCTYHWEGSKSFIFIFLLNLSTSISPILIHIIMTIIAIKFPWWNTYNTIT